jgi:formyltetrahydrofolate deformylase
MNPMDDHAATLLVCCPDRPGLVAELAQALYVVGANILDTDQHTDPVVGKFFQRIHFAGARTHGDALLELLRNAISDDATRAEVRLSLHPASHRKRVALFVSKTDHCLYDLLLRHRSGELVCDIVLIVSNHDTLRPIAEQFGIPFHWFPVTPDDKAEVEASELALLVEHEVDLVVLARYMQILSDGFVRPWEARIINIHHSFLPAFAGGRPYHQAYARGVKRVGATAHYATAELDEGPIIEQDVIRVSHRDSPADLVRKGRDVERTVLSRAVRLHLEDRVLVYDNKTVVFDG